MSDELKALNRRFNEEVINEQNLAVRSTSWWPRTSSTTSPCPGRGRAARASRRRPPACFLGAFPDLRMEVVAELAEGDVVAQVVRFTGTHRGEFMGLPATGKEVSVLGSDFVRAQGGQDRRALGLRRPGAADAAARHGARRAGLGLSLPGGPEPRCGLRLDQEHQALGDDAVVVHRGGGPLGLHRGHDGVHVGHVHEDRDVVRIPRVDEGADVGDPENRLKNSSRFPM